MKKLIAMLMAVMMVLCSVSALAETAGGWTIPEDTFPSQEAFDAFTGAVGNDSDLLPAAVLGTQVVAGINYAILCNVPAGWEIAYVYHNVSGEDTLMREQMLVEMGEGLAGGYNKLDEAGLAPETLELLNSAFNGMMGINVKESIVLGQQVVAGMNYMLLCRVATVTAEPAEHWALAVVYVDLDNNATVTEMSDVELSLYAEE